MNEVDEDIESEIENNLVDENSCPYCEESFDSDREKGIHMADEHMTGDSINRRNQRKLRDKNKLREWKENMDDKDDEESDEEKQ